MLFQCWMLNMAIIGVALPGPPYISSQASIRRQRWLWGVSGRPSLFQSRRCVSLGQVLKDGGMPVWRLAFGPQVVIYAWTDCSPQSQEWCEPVPSTFAGWKKGPCTAMFATTMPVGPPCLEGPRKRLHFSCVKAVPFLGPLICLKVAPGTQTGKSSCLCGGHLGGLVCSAWKLSSRWIQSLCGR